MTELMKRYESETGKQSAIVRFMAGGQALESKSYPKLGPYDYSMDYIAWLEAQLTWRPARSCARSQMRLSAFNRGP